MSKNYEKLKTLLLELFQLDQPELDFGIYRILHAKSAEVTQFLERDLLPQVKQAFAQYQPADKAALQKELDKVIAGLRDAGVDPEQAPKIKELRAKLASDAVDLDALESETYDHLYSFFRRYYSEGDFLSKRVYKPGVYAIPYEGEEVKLHWANADQYYIKTSEYLRDYAFRLRPDDEKNPMRVHFRLVNATEGEHGNVKEAQGKERRFRLVETDAMAVESGELVIRFTYQPDERKQKDLNAAAEAALLATQAPELAEWMRELSKPHRRADGTEAGTRLRVNLELYTGRNTFDYFIHKDLGGFLRRELDFYIKNEVMHLDDVENETVPRVEQYLSKIKVIRQIASKIIDFLAQLENFQKKLWLKKKFVVETSWLIRVGCIPEAFYAEIAQNEAQREEWVRLLAIDKLKGDLTTPGYSTALTVAFITAHPTLTLDTRHYDVALNERLLGAIGVPDEDGVLIHAENFQALSLMQVSRRGRIKCVYIDPPYNTDASPISYKNGYQRSSWIALLADRVSLDAQLLVRPSIRCVAIDDFEYPDLIQVLGSLSSETHHATAPVRSKPQGRPTATGFSANHEYAVFWGDPEATIGRLPRVGSKADRYPHRDEHGVFAWANFRKSGTDSDRTDRPKSFYPVFVARETGQVRVPAMSWDAAKDAWVLTEEPAGAEIAVLPVDANCAEKVWTCSPGRAKAELTDLRVAGDEGGRLELLKKYRPNQEGALPGTWWDDPEYSASESGTKVLKDLFGARDFDYPKSVHLVRDCLRVGSVQAGDTVLDYFAGSGTTGHAVINLNREDGGCRRFILVEMGNYFDTVLLPRLKKVIFSPEWKDGKAKRLATAEEAARSPRILKVLRLESYEDALNNLETRRTGTQRTLLDSPEAEGDGGLKEQYLLRYMLDVETRGSQSLLNVQAFTDPTAYKLKVKRPGSDESREVNVDLLETFNWLIGLTVQHLAAPRTFSAAFKPDAEKRLGLDGHLKQDPAGPFWFRPVTGTIPDGRKTLVIWRKLTGKPEEDNLVLDKWFTKQGYSSKDSEFDLIYVNGDNNLENLKTPEDTWKVRLLEEDFHRLMFDTEGA